MAEKGKKPSTHVRKKEYLHNCQMCHENAKKDQTFGVDEDADINDAFRCCLSVNGLCLSP